ncbi:phage tail protein [Pedobacter nototheniae]|uniref:phage tail protein n=1 Tax=Pedobacter nototheniae TaxID=2488994 RepID=UPI00103E44ED|nr:MULTISPECIES: tail fiber protein [Pedobacter]
MASEAFVAEISIVAFNFAPRGWATCDGQLLPLSQNTALFSLLGTTYGGDGRTTFGLPNMQGLAPMGPGQGQGLSLHDLGETGGEANTSLQLNQLPSHTHNVVPVLKTGGTATSVNPDNAMPAVALNNELIYSTTAGAGTMKPMDITTQNTNPFNGGGQPHNNMQPYLTLNFIIALQGIFPSRS